MRDSRYGSLSNYNLALMRAGSEVMAEEGKALRQEYLKKIQNARIIIRQLLPGRPHPAPRQKGVLPLRTAHFRTHLLGYPHFGTRSNPSRRNRDGNQERHLRYVYGQGQFCPAAPQTGRDAGGKLFWVSRTRLLPSEVQSDNASRGCYFQSPEPQTALRRPRKKRQVADRP